MRVASSPGEFARDFELVKQMRRSSGSMMDSIAEGFERDGRNEFIQLLSIGKGSSGELRSQLYRALDNHCISQAQFDGMSGKIATYGKLVNGLMSYLKTTERKGTKFRDRQ